MDVEGSAGPAGILCEGAYSIINVDGEHAVATIIPGYFVHLRFTNVGYANYRYAGGVDTHTNGILQARWW